MANAAAPSTKNARSARSPHSTSRRNRLRRGLPLGVRLPGLPGVRGPSLPALRLVGAAALRLVGAVAFRLVGAFLAVPRAVVALRSGLKGEAPGRGTVTQPGPPSRTCGRGTH